MEKAHEFSVLQNGEDAINTSITPWEVEGDIDYNRLIEEFGTQSIGNHLFSRLKLPLPPPVRRGMCFSHRDLDKWLNAYDYASQVAKKITYSTAKAVFGLKPENNIGWVFYPAMQAAHILYPQFIEGYHQTLVPIGIDQDPFMRLTRDIAERFGFQKPAAIHKKLAPGLEGPKMSSSGNNAIWLSDDEDAVASKVHKHAFSGGQPSIKEHREKGGNPDVDVLKEYFIEKVNNYLKEHRRKREMVKKNIDEYMLRE